MVELGCGEILLTSMDTDGVQQGFDLPILKAIATSVPVPVIASGGAGTLRHFADALTEGEADAALAASLFHFGQLTIGEVKDYLAAQGIPVRRLRRRMASGNFEAVLFAPFPHKKIPCRFAAG